MEKSIVEGMLKKYSSVVIWGLLHPTDSTQKHVHRHLFDTLQKINFPVHWCENAEQCNGAIPNGSLVISSNECYQNLKYNKKNWYAFFNVPEPINDCRNFLRMTALGAEIVSSDFVYWNTTTAFNKEAHKLYQPFVTNLLPWEFQHPIFTNSKVIHWVGSIWNDANNHGNLETIDALKRALDKHGLEFRHCVGITDDENIIKVRESRIAPAIGGTFQTKGMLPCRLWKNISYGQLGVTNLSKAVDVFGENLIFSLNVEEAVDKALNLPEKAYIDMVQSQQEIVSSGYTYLNWFYNVLKALEELG